MMNHIGDFIKLVQFHSNVFNIQIICPYRSFPHLQKNPFNNYYENISLKYSLINLRFNILNSILSYRSRLESLVEDLGVCGLLQKLLCIILHLAVIVTLGILGMAFIGYDPNFTCQTLDVERTAISLINISEILTYRLCYIGSYATYSSSRYSQGFRCKFSRPLIMFCSYLTEHCHISWSMIYERPNTYAFVFTCSKISLISFCMFCMFRK